MMRSLRMFAAAMLLPVALSAQASTVVSSGFANPFTVSSYSMYNGGTGGYQYHDYLYPSPNATTDFAWLSGGTGLLTDGVGATLSWNEGALNPIGFEQGVFVGWYIDQTITFYFNTAITFSHMRVNFDVSNDGGVEAPGPVTINGVEYATTAPSGTEPFWADYDLTGFPAATSQGIEFTRNAGVPWIMISEVQFGNETVAPEPSSLVLLGTGLVGVLTVVRRRRRP